MIAKQRLPSGAVMMCVTMQDVSSGVLRISRRGSGVKVHVAVSSDSWSTELLNAFLQCILATKI